MSDAKTVLSSRLYLVKFLQRYAELLVVQLEEVRAEMVRMVEHLMSNVQGMAEQTQEEQKKATEVLEKTYLTPDSETKDLLTNIQAAVDSVLEEAMQKVDGGNTQESPLSALSEQADQETEDPISTSLRRFATRFSKNAESQATVDDELQNIVMSMVGTLSNEDVIGQKIEHILRAIHALNVGLAYMVLDFENRFHEESVTKLKADLLAYVLKTYTTEDEARIFARHFDRPDAVSAVS